MRALLLPVVFALVGASACAHMITVESTPPGALVLVEGKPAGRTPVTFEETTGRDDLVTVEVQQGDDSARFAYQKTGVSMDAVMGSVGVGCGMCALGGGGLVGLLLLVPALAVVAANPALGVGLIIGGYAAYVVGILLVSNAPYATVIGIGEGARKGPERIHVDFSRAAPIVTSSPADMTVPLVGRSARTAPQRY